jgi:hypothetical protein
MRTPWRSWSYSQRVDPATQELEVARYSTREMSENQSRHDRMCRGCTL